MIIRRASLNVVRYSDTLLRELKNKAASGDSRRKYATDNDTTTN